MKKLVVLSLALTVAFAFGCQKKGVKTGGLPGGDLTKGLDAKSIAVKAFNESLNPFAVKGFKKNKAAVNKKEWKAWQKENGAKLKDVLAKAPEGVNVVLVGGVAEGEKATLGKGKKAKSLGEERAKAVKAALKKAKYDVSKITVKAAEGVTSAIVTFEGAAAEAPAAK